MIYTIPLFHTTLNFKDNREVAKNIGIEVSKEILIRSYSKKNKTHEVKKLIDSFINIKHKVMIALIYSAGLRLSEASNIQIKDIDIERKLIHIRLSMGKKDRYTILSDNLIYMITSYIDEYKSKIWFFAYCGYKKLAAIIQNRITHDKN